MNAEAKLTAREAEVAELLAWGAAKKEVADRLIISPRTVENTARKIYEKLGIQKATELCVWWFCTHCGISFDLSPLKRQIIAICLLAIIIPSELQAAGSYFRVSRAQKTMLARRASGRRRAENEVDFTTI